MGMQTLHHLSIPSLNVQAEDMLLPDIEQRKRYLLGTEYMPVGQKSHCTSHRGTHAVRQRCRTLPAHTLQRRCEWPQERCHQAWCTNRVLPATVPLLQSGSTP
jgi:hypothetical protein